MVGGEILFQEFYDGVFDVSGGNTGDRPSRRGLGLSMLARRRHVVAIADASFCGVSCDHAMAGVVEQQFCQQVLGFVADDGAVGPLGEGFLPDCVKQRVIHNWGLLAGQDLILVFDLADIEVVAQQVIQRAATERDATARRARREPFYPRPDFAFLEVPNQFVDAAKF